MANHSPPDQTPQFVATPTLMGGTFQSSTDYNFTEGRFEFWVSAALEDWRSGRGRMAYARTSNGGIKSSTCHFDIDFLINGSWRAPGQSLAFTNAGLCPIRLR